MVLGSREGLVLSAAAVALLCVACVHDKPVRRLSKPEAVTVAIVHDLGSGVGTVPAELVEGLKRPLIARNLVPEFLEASVYAADFATTKDSQSRVDYLVERSESAYVLLVETRAQFFSQMQGRYRWTVYMRLSLQKRGGGGTDAGFSLPVVLTYEHEREDSALAQSAGPSSRKLARMLDGFLGSAADTVAGPSQASAAGKAARAPSSRSIYFVLVDRFANGAPDGEAATDASDPHAYHGGDIPGLTARLDYIRDLGFDSIWITPVFAQRTEKINGIGAFHGYWTEDLSRVEPRFGSEADLRKLADELEARGMGLVLDMVLNHVGYDTELTAREDWFHHNGDIVDWNDPRQLTQNDVHGLPDLAQENEEVYRYLADASVEWIRRLSPSGLRLDAVKHISMEFWSRYNREMAGAGPEPPLLLGEYYDGSPAELAQALKEGGFTALFDFPLHFAMIDVFCKGAHPGRLAAILSDDRLYPDPEQLVTFADNHDLPRVATQCQGDLDRVRQLLRFQMSARGMASMTYGTENGMQGGDEPANRGDMSFEADAPLAGDIRRLLRWRVEHDLLGAAQTILRVDETLFAYARVAEERAQIFVYNRSETDVAVPIPAALRGASSAQIAAEDGRVAPGQAGVIVLEGDFADYKRRLEKPGMVKVTIAVTGAPEGELFIAGTGPELGGWAVDKAAKTSGGRVEISVPSGVVFAAKPVVVTADGRELWAPGADRYIVADGAPVSLSWQ